jgi:hypothetical protein
MTLPAYENVKNRRLNAFAGWLRIGCAFGFRFPVRFPVSRAFFRFPVALALGFRQYQRVGKP